MKRKIPAAVVAALLLFAHAPSRSPARAQSSSQAGADAARRADSPAWMKDVLTKLETELTAKYGEAQRVRASRGLRQVSNFWRAEDGDAAAFEEFVRTNFAGEPATLDTMFARFQHNLEQLYGHMGEIGHRVHPHQD